MNFSQVSTVSYPTMNGNYCIRSSTYVENRVPDCKFHEAVNPAVDPMDGYCFQCFEGFSVTTDRLACKTPKGSTAHQLIGCKKFSNSNRTRCEQCLPDYEQVDKSKNKNCLRPTGEPIEMHTYNIFINLRTDKNLCTANGSILNIVSDEVLKIGNLSFAEASCKTKPTIIADITIIRAIYDDQGKPKF